MSILVERASLEDRARFFRKNRPTISRLLGDLAEPAKKPKRKKKAKAKVKEKPKPKAEAKAKVKAKAKPKAKVKEKPKAEEQPKTDPVVEEKDLSVEEPVTVTEAPVQEAPTTDACAPTDSPDDLTRIKGLGAKMVKNLNAAGISTFEQIANLSKAQITELSASIRGFAANYKGKDFKKQAEEFSQ